MPKSLGVQNGKIGEMRSAARFVCMFSTNVPKHHRRNNRRDRGRLVPQLLGWEINNVLVPRLLGRSQKFHSKYITGMQDLASEFSQIFHAR